jgi:O-antigen ligase
MIEQSAPEGLMATGQPAQHSIALRLQRAGVGVAIACMAAMLVLPFVWPSHTQPLSAFYNEWFAALLLILACLVIAARHVRSDASAFELPAVAPLFLPLILVILLQWGLGRLNHSSDAVFPLVTLALATAALTLGKALATRAGLPRLLFCFSVAVIAGALVNVALQILQLCAASGIRFSYFNFHSNGVYYGALAQPNHLATYLGWALIGAIYLNVTQRLRGARLAALIVALLVGMTLTASRTGWLHVVWISLMAAWAMRRMHPDASSLRTSWMLGMPILFALINLGLPHFFEVVGLSFQGNVLGRVVSEGIDGARRTLYTQGLQIFSDHPLLGVGPGQLVYQQFQLLDEAATTVYASSAHNVVLDLFVLTGVVGAVPFLVIAGAWLLRSMKPALTAERVAALLMLSTLAIHAMLELPLWYAYFLFPAALLVGALDTGGFKLRSGSLFRVLPVLICVYGLVVAGSMLVQYRQIESLFARYYIQKRILQPVDEKRVAEILDHQRTTWFTGATEFLLCTNFAMNNIALQEKLAIAARTMRHQPEPHVAYRYVLLLALDGRYEEGAVILQRTRKMFPDAYDEIAAEFIQLGEQQPALFGKLADALKEAV